MSAQKSHRRAAAEYLDLDSPATLEWIRTGVDGGTVAFGLMALAAQFAKFEDLGKRKAGAAHASEVDRLTAEHRKERADLWEMGWAANDCGRMRSENPYREQLSKEPTP